MPSLISGALKSLFDWNAVINGLLGSSQLTAEQRLISRIDQAFNQSPYLSIK